MPSIQMEKSLDTNVLTPGLITKEARSPVARIIDQMLSGSIIYCLRPCSTRAAAFSAFAI